MSFGSPDGRFNFCEKVFIIESIIKQFEPVHKCDGLKNDKRPFLAVASS